MIPHKIDTTGSQVTELRAAFPGWNIWVSDGGHWYATRRTRLHDHAPLFGLWPMVDGADLTALRTQLTLQAERAAAVLEVISTFAWSLACDRHLWSSNRAQTCRHPSAPSEFPVSREVVLAAQQAVVNALRSAPWH